MARYIDRAMKFASELLEICFDGIYIHKEVHVCCGYPEKLDDKKYKKAKRGTYNVMAEILENSPTDGVSIEDAHRHNDLSELLPLFKTKEIVLGVVDRSTTYIETVDEIVDRATEALNYIDFDRLWLAPDCGLAMLP